MLATEKQYLSASRRVLPVQMLVRHFTLAGEQWQIAPGIRDMVQFRTLNLLNDFSPFGMVDVAFCRNVLIYFDQPTNNRVLERIARQMSEDGYLVLGAAETVVGLTDAFRPVAEKCGIYVPNAEARRPAVRALEAANVVSLVLKVEGMAALVCALT